MRKGVDKINFRSCRVSAVWAPVVSFYPCVSKNNKEGKEGQPHRKEHKNRRKGRMEGGKEGVGGRRQETKNSKRTGQRIFLFHLI